MKMDFIEVSVENKRYMSRELMRPVPEPFNVLFLSRSDSRKYILVADADYYFVFKIGDYNLQRGKAYSRYIGSREISVSEAEYNFYEYVWHEEYGVVSLLYEDECRKGNIDFVYDENLFERTARPFCRESCESDNVLPAGSDGTVF